MKTTFSNPGGPMYRESKTHENSGFNFVECERIKKVWTWRSWSPSAGQRWKDVYFFKTQAAAVVPWSGQSAQSWELQFGHKRHTCLQNRCVFECILKEKRFFLEEWSPWHRCSERRRWCSQSRSKSSRGTELKMKRDFFRNLCCSTTKMSFSLEKSKGKYLTAWKMGFLYSM